MFLFQDGIASSSTRCRNPPIQYVAGLQSHRPVDLDSLATSVTSPAESCDDDDEVESIGSSSDVLSVAASGFATAGAYSDDVDSAADTLRSDYDNRVGWLPSSLQAPRSGGVGNEASWRSLADHVSGGGYQIQSTGNPPIGRKAGTGDYPVSRTFDGVPT